MVATHGAILNMMIVEFVGCSFEFLDYESKCGTDFIPIICALLDNGWRRFGAVLWAASIAIRHESVVSVFASAVRSSSAHVMWLSMRFFSWLVINCCRAVPCQRCSIFCR